MDVFSLTEPEAGAPFSEEGPVLLASTLSCVFLLVLFSFVLFFPGLDSCHLALGSWAVSHFSVFLRRFVMPETPRPLPVSPSVADSEYPVRLPLVWFLGQLSHFWFLRAPLSVLHASPFVLSYSWFRDAVLSLRISVMLRFCLWPDPPSSQFPLCPFWSWVFSVVTLGCTSAFENKPVCRVSG